jgi:glycogen synthase
LVTYQNVFKDKEEGFYVDNNTPELWYKTMNTVLDMSETDRDLMKDKIQQRIKADFNQAITIQKWVDFYNRVLAI